MHNILSSSIYICKLNRPKKNLFSFLQEDWLFSWTEWIIIITLTCKYLSQRWGSSRSEIIILLSIWNSCDYKIEYLPWRGQSLAWRIILQWGLCVHPFPTLVWVHPDFPSWTSSFSPFWGPLPLEWQHSGSCQPVGSVKRKLGGKNE